MPPNLARDHDGDVLRYANSVNHLDEDASSPSTTSPSILRCAILGCGMMGQEHISYIAGYPGQIRIDYLCDPHESSIEASLKVLKAFDKTCNDDDDNDKTMHLPRIVRSEQELFNLTQGGNNDDTGNHNHHKIDLLVIATPNYLHTDTILQWATRDVTILCEKPVAVSQLQHDALLALQASGNLRARLWIAMEYRFIPAVAKLLTLLCNNDEATSAVGQIKMITIRENRYPFLHKIGAWNREPSKTGDTLVEKCCHFFDLFRLITGAEVKLPKIKAMAQRGINYTDEEQHPGAQNDQQCPIIDAAYVMFPMQQKQKQQPQGFGATKTSSSLMACLELCMYAEGSRHQEEIIVTGTKGRLEAYLPENKVYAYTRPSATAWKDRSVPPPKAEPVIYDCANVAAVHGIDQNIPTHGGYHYSSTAVEWYKLLKAVRNHQDTGVWQPDVSLSDGLAAVQIGLQATRALWEDASNTDDEN